MSTTEPGPNDQTEIIPAIDVTQVIPLPVPGRCRGTARGASGGDRRAVARLCGNSGYRGRHKETTSVGTKVRTTIRTLGELMITAGLVLLLFAAYEVWGKAAIVNAHQDRSGHPAQPGVGQPATDTGGVGTARGGRPWPGRPGSRSRGSTFPG